MTKARVKRCAERRIKVKYVKARKGLKNEVDTCIETFKGRRKDRH